MGHDEPMRVTVRLDPATPAGALGQDLLAVRQRIGVAERLGVDLDVLRERERVLSDRIISTLARRGHLLGAVGRVGGPAVHPHHQEAKR